MVVEFMLSGIVEAVSAIISATEDRRVLALEGQMGAGKTTLITAVCRRLGVTDPISSPTFSIINEYRTVKGEVIYHMDLYRLNSESEAINAGVEDCLFSGNRCFVEWPERIPGIFPSNTLRSLLTVEPNSQRRLEINL
jgi:tRNA threonylcarbamoyladenosine biosynthesis protein TsaE